MNSTKYQTTWRPADIAFLAMALLLHAALLLLPLKAWQSPAPAAIPRLTIDLQKLPGPPQQAEVEKTRPELPVTEKSEPEPEPESGPEPVPAAQRTARIALQELPEKPQDAPAAEATQPNLPSARQLRELIRPEDLQEASRTERRLGSARPWQPPANWSKNAGAPYLADSNNRFNGMTVPEDVEIVDRWMAADGSHNVVLNMPNGDTLCGRAEAYNPTQPLVEPIMMFRPCGGGGKRTFSMPDRYHRGE